MGKRPDLFAGIVQMAIIALKLLINRIFRMEEPERVTAERSGEYSPKIEAASKHAQKPAEPIKGVEKTEQKPPDRPKKSKLASEFPRLEKVYVLLQKQSKTVYQIEEIISELEQRLSETTGMFKGKQRKALQGEIEQAQKQLADMKQSIQRIAKQHGYKSVKAFVAEFNVSKAEYEAYQKEIQNYERKLAGKPEKASIHERLQRGKQEVKEREASKQRTVVKPKDRGAR